MRHTQAEQTAVLQAIDRLYQEIRELEAAYHLRAAEGDFRPRIEYFHDAIRAYTSSDKAARSGGRLSVEQLAHDLGFLRHIGEVPLASLRRTRTHESPGTAVARQGQAPATGTGRPDREIRQRLGELYKHYAVMFAALLKEAADRDYRSRVEELHGEVRDLAALHQALQQFERGKASLGSLEATIAQLENDELHAMMEAALSKLVSQKATLTPELIRRLKQRIAERDKREAAIEKAHFSYVASQLAVYEEAKEVVKKLAMQGLNLAGKFLESAAREASQRGARGR